MLGAGVWPPYQTLVLAGLALIRPFLAAHICGKLPQRTLWIEHMGGPQAPQIKNPEPSRTRDFRPKRFKCLKRIRDASEEESSHGAHLYCVVHSAGLRFGVLECRQLIRKVINSYRSAQLGA